MSQLLVTSVEKSVLSKALNKYLTRQRTELATKELLYRIEDDRLERLVAQVESLSEEAEKQVLLDLSQSDLRTLLAALEAYRTLDVAEAARWDQVARKERRGKSIHDMEQRLRSQLDSSPSAVDDLSVLLRAAAKHLTVVRDSEKDFSDEFIELGLAILTMLQEVIGNPYVEQALRMKTIRSKWDDFALIAEPNAFLGLDGESGPEYEALKNVHDILSQFVGKA